MPHHPMQRCVTCPAAPPLIWREDAAGHPMPHQTAPRHHRHHHTPHHTPCGTTTSAHSHMHIAPFRAHPTAPLHPSLHTPRNRYIPDHTPCYTSHGSSVPLTTHLTTYVWAPRDTPHPTVTNRQHPSPHTPAHTLRHHYDTTAPLTALCTTALAAPRRNSHRSRHLKATHSRPPPAAPGSPPPAGRRPWCKCRRRGR